MISSVLLRRSLKSGWKLTLIFSLVLAFYFSIIAGMYDPESLDVVEMLASMKLSPELLSAMGFTLTDTSLTGFLSSYFYGLLMLAFPMICYILLGNGAMVKLVDHGSMACILSTPISRKKVAVTQALYLLLAVTVLIGVVTVWGIAYCTMQFPDLLDVGLFLKINLGALLLHYALSGICFFASCLFNETRRALILGAGLPIAFLLIQMLANANTEIEALKYMTIFSLFQPAEILKGEPVWLPLLALGVIAAVLYSSAVAVFQKKDLPL